MEQNNSHNLFFGYLFWLFGFMGAHRFYYGRPVSGVIYFFTLGIIGIGWIIDLFLIPSMDRQADRQFLEGPIDYTVGWILLVFLGFLGIHRFYMASYLMGILFFLTGGLFGFGYLYDLCTLNSQIDERNSLPAR